ncbi:MFS general substrate transporter [Daedalea quercina L-15889]|uniref:MFS general substrate transporter n=1 Tax=Daedalea quercina L-15889 TaxID=1314783 RepID=A0A165N2B1_9APHY|nr:MFS general substrate transporter [Daedalea quercina L-15889]
MSESLETKYTLPDEKGVQEQPADEEVQRVDDSTANLPQKEERSEPNQSQQIVFPDGGRQAWLTVLGGWLVAFCTFGFASSYGVFQDYYVEENTSSASNISWIGSLQLFFMFLMGLPSGKLFDQGYFHHIMIVGSVLYVFSLMMLSIANTTRYYELLLAQGISSGLGSGLILVPALSVQSHHWRKRRALAMGIVLMGSSSGGVVYPIMLNQLFNNGLGFAWSVRAAAFMTLGMLVLANFMLSTRLPSAKQRPPGAPSPSVAKVATDGPYIVVLLSIFLGLWGLLYPYFYLQLWVSSQGLSQTLAFYSVAILNAGSTLGRASAGALADRIGAFNSIVPVSFICGGLVFAMLGAKTPGGVIAFAILYGIFSGAYISLCPPLLAAMARSTHEVGLRIGLGYFITSFAILTGTPISGALLGSLDRWYKPTLFSGVVILAGTATAVVARAMMVKRKGTQLV